MGVRHQQLVEQLVPLLKFYVAYPTSVNQANAGILSFQQVQAAEDAREGAPPPINRVFLCILLSPSI